MSQTQQNNSGTEESSHGATNVNLNSTLRKLDNTLEQQTAAAVSGMTLPIFKGQSNEDVHDFIRKFKLATFALSEKHRCLALNRSLSGSANCWAKSNIREAIINGNWKAIKKALIERFGSSDTALRYRLKLNEMRYDPKNSITLLGYAEIYLRAHSKAHNNQNEQDGILSLKLNLPNNVIRSLNVLDDKWHKYNSHSELFALIKRYELNILPYESNEEDKDKLIDGKLILEALNELRRERQDDIKDTKAALAIMSATKSTEKPRDPERYRYNPNPRFKYYQRNNYNKQPYRNSNRTHEPDNKKPKFDKAQPFAITNDSQANQPAHILNGSFQPKPPYPCRFCGQDHFHKDCPTRDNNLN